MSKNTKDLRKWGYFFKSTLNPTIATAFFNNNGLSETITIQ